MPLSAIGRRILVEMTRTYTRQLKSRTRGAMKAKRVFMAMEAEGKMTPKAFVGRRRKQRTR